MPSYGFGEIISGQELDLCMLYSPKKEDILSNTENFACVQGLAKFQIEVSSIFKLLTKIILIYLNDP